MMLLRYEDGKVADSTWVPIGGAVCGQGCNAILFDVKDFEHMLEGLNSESGVMRQKMIDYLSHIQCRFEPSSPRLREVVLT